MQADRRKTILILVGIFLLAYAFRLIYYAEVQDQIYFQALLFDAKAYDEWAKDILQNGWLGDKVFFTSPLYAYFLAIVYKLGGDPTVIKFIQFGFGALTCLFVYGIGVLQFGRKTALLAALIAACYKGSIFFEGFLLKTALEVVFTYAALFLVFLAHKQKKNKLWLLAGICTGFSTLAKDTTLILVPLVCLWLLWESHSFAGLFNWRRWFSRAFVKPLKPFLFFALGAGLIVGALTTRNMVVGKDFVLTSYGGGINFYLGNCRGSDGAIKSPDFQRIDPKYEELDAQVEAERRAGKKLKPSESSAFWVQETFNEIKQDPANFTNLILRKMGLLVHRKGISDNYQMGIFQRYSLLFHHLLISIWPILACGLAGILLSLRKRETRARHILLILFFLATAAVLVLMHIIDRYREVLVPILILFSAFTILETWQAIRKKRLWNVALAAVLVTTFAFTATLRLPNFVQNHLSDAHLQIGNLHEKNANLQQAVAEYQLAIQERPDHLWALEHLARAQLALGNFDEAIRQYKRAIFFRPDVLPNYWALKKAIDKKRGRATDNTAGRKPAQDKGETNAGPSPSYSLGSKHLANGELELALAQYNKVLKADPDNHSARMAIGITYQRMGKREEKAKMPDKAMQMYQKAIPMYQEVLRRAPPLTPARYSLAMTYLNIGRPRDALPHLHKIAALYPEYKRTRYILGQVYANPRRLKEVDSGQLKRGLKYYREFVGRTHHKIEHRELVKKAAGQMELIVKELQQRAKAKKQ